MIYRRALEVHPGNLRARMQLAQMALYENRLDEAERGFTEVGRAMRGVASVWPFSARLAASLGMLYYRQDRFSEAARAFERAAGPVAFGPFRDLQALGVHCSHLDEGSYSVHGPDRTEVSLLRTDPLPAVGISVNGSGPVPFVIDTGAAEVVLDTAFAMEVGAPVVASMRGEGAGPAGRVGLGKVAGLAIGSVTVSNVPIHCLDTSRFAAALEGLPVKGIIGTRLLHHFVTTMDYRAGRLILQRRGGPEPPELNAAEAKKIPFWLVQTHYIVAPGTVNRTGPMLFLVDTGLAGKAFTAPADTLKQAGITVDWTEARKGIGGFGDVKQVEFVVDRLTLGSGQNEIEKRAVLGVALKPQVPVLGRRLGFRLAGLVSHQFFRDGALTLDFKGMSLVISRGN